MWGIVSSIQKYVKESTFFRLQSMLKLISYLFLATLELTLSLLHSFRIMQANGLKNIRTIKVSIIIFITSLML